MFCWWRWWWQWYRVFSNKKKTVRLHGTLSLNWHILLFFVCGSVTFF